MLRLCHFKSALSSIAVVCLPAKCATEDTARLVVELCPRLERVTPFGVFANYFSSDTIEYFSQRCEQCGETTKNLLQQFVSCGMCQGRNLPSNRKIHYCSVCSMLYKCHGCLVQACPHCISVCGSCQRPYCESCKLDMGKCPQC